MLELNICMIQVSKQGSVGKIRELLICPEVSFPIDK